MIAVYLNNRPTAYITYVSVLEKYKRQGLYDTMFLRLEIEVILMAFDNVKLEVREDNTPAINAYKKVGFILYKNKENKSRMINSLKHIMKNYLEETIC